jgi:hypothetical protein
VNLVASVPFSRCRPNAVSTHYRASPPAAPGARLLDPQPPHDFVELRRLIQCNTPEADRTDVCLLQALLAKAFARFQESVTSRRVGGRYRSRTCDSQIPDLVLYPLS